MSDMIIRGLVKRYGEKTVLGGLDCTFEKGGIYCVTGPSGCGKTTLLRIIAGLEKPDEGKAEGFGRCAFVFQEDRLVRHMSAEANIAMVCRDRQRIAAALEKTGLSDAGLRPVSAFSGGMARRTAIVRAVLAESDVLLLDEPFKGLDGQIMEKTAAFVHRNLRGRTLIAVTHSEKEALLFGSGAVFTGGLSVSKLNTVDNQPV